MSLNPSDNSKIYAVEWRIDCIPVVQMLLSNITEKDSLGSNQRCKSGLSGDCRGSYRLPALGMILTS